MPAPEPLLEKESRELFKRIWYAVFLVCFLIIPFVEPVRSFIAPPVEKFVKAYLEIFLNLLYFVFFTCSLSLIILAALAHREFRATHDGKMSYKSQLIVKKYYEDRKPYDFAKAISTAISKYSRRDLGPADTAEEVKPDGTHQIFYPNGQVEKEFNYKNGKLNGLWRSYYPDGILHQEKYFKDGMLNGTFRAYDDQGVLFFEINYKDGQKHGPEKNYYRNGSVEYMDTFQEGVLINRKTFDESGELRFDHDYQKGEGKGQSNLPKR